MQRPITCAAALLLIVAGCTRHGIARPDVDASARRVPLSGPVVGFTGQYGSHVWRGIPYADPPVGDRRWRAPDPPRPWTDARVALDYGAPCTQYASPIGGVPGREGSVVGSEDCLYLNVYAPRVAADAVPTGAARWPVMVWIHGGGNSIGQAGFYDGGHLAAAEHVVVVTVNYRLGPFGWFRHAALRAGSGDPAEQSGNFATLDLIHALTWVHNNIGAFGGNPDNVTIFGESAGGQNVFTLLLAPRAKGLFHRAIVESGGLWSSSAAEGENFVDAPDPGDPRSSNEVLLALLVADGSAPDRAAARARLNAMTATDIARYLRAKSAAEVMAVYTPWPRNGMLEMPKVFRDGALLPDADPMTRFANADGYNRVPVMLGTNRDENKLFMFSDPRWVRQYFWIVPRLRDARLYDVTAEYLAAMWKATGADEPAAALRADNPAVYVYRFDWRGEPTLLGADLGVMLGAAHGFEIPFVFGHFDLGKDGNMLFTEENRAGREALAKAMMGYWAEFARYGAPRRGGGEAQPEWLPWSTGDWAPKFLVFDTAAGGGIRAAADDVSVARVLAGLDGDPRLSAPRDKCVVLHDLARWARGFSRAAYAARPECTPYPYDTYPWDG
jgi:para-nitrobenzyl esterase